ncbi:MAG: SprT-like domain-containing protein [Thermodesulfovibrionales bacterium]
MQQLRLSFGNDKDSIRTYLENVIQKPVSLTITDNSASMISCRSSGRMILLRLHRMFLMADFEVLDELASYLTNGKRKTPLIRGFINDNGHQIRKGPSRPITLKTRGRHHDLEKVFDEVNKEYFDGRISAGITWGSRGPRRYARMRTLGSYVSDDNIIRINPVLDSRRVPKYFVEFVVYHEMLHADLGFGRKEGRRSVHSKEFRSREKLFRHYERAIKWEL